MKQISCNNTVGVTLLVSFSFVRPSVSFLQLGSNDYVKQGFWNKEIFEIYDINCNQFNYYILWKKKKYVNWWKMCLHILSQYFWLLRNKMRTIYRLLSIKWQQFSDYWFIHTWYIIQSPIFLKSMCRWDCKKLVWVKLQW